MVVYNLICKKSINLKAGFRALKISKAGGKKADFMSDMRQQASREDAPCLRRPCQEGAGASEKIRTTGGNASDAAVAR